MLFIQCFAQLHTTWARFYLALRKTVEFQPKHGLQAHTLSNTSIRSMQSDACTSAQAQYACRGETTLHNTVLPRKAQRIWKGISTLTAGGEVHTEQSNAGALLREDGSI